MTEQPSKGVMDVRASLTIRRDMPTRAMPCALCGSLVPHQLVEPFSLAKLTFRATIVDGKDAWLPLAHSQGGFCPDPPASTRSFWTNDLLRENWKREARERMLRLR